MSTCQAGRSVKKVNTKGASPSDVRFSSWLIQKDATKAETGFSEAT
jgi:hypothetical protein